MRTLAVNRLGHITIMTQDLEIRGEIMFDNPEIDTCSIITQRKTVASTTSVDMVKGKKFWLSLSATSTLASIMVKDKLSVFSSISQLSLVNYFFVALKVFEKGCLRFLRVLFSPLPHILSVFCLNTGSLDFSLSHCFFLSVFIVC